MGTLCTYARTCLRALIWVTGGLGAFALCWGTVRAIVWLIVGR